ncbi:MAG: sulfatase [Acidobacteriota bacterium]
MTPLRSSPADLRRLLVLAALPLALAACGGQERSTSELLDPRFDPQLLALDAAGPACRFDGTGSILRVDGWARTETAGDPVFPFAWAVDGRAVLELPSPATDAPVDFWADVMPLALGNGTDQAPQSPQEISVWVAGEELGSAVLEEGWNEVRIPLPAEALDADPVAVELRFAWAVRPQDVGLGPDNRRLSASFRHLAFVPRWVESPADFRARLGESFLGDRYLEIPAGAGVEIPLAAGRPAALSLGEVRVDGRCTGCRLQLALVGNGDDPKDLWSGTAEDAGGLELQIEPPAVHGSRLRWAWAQGRGDGGTAGDGALRLDLGDDFLSIEAPPSEGGADPNPQGGGRPPHVFVYLIDTLRADAFEPWGGEGTPAVADLARDSVTYVDAWTSSSWTLPATASVLTGVYPDRHGVMTGEIRLSDKAPPSLATLLTDRGYRTLGLSQSVVASGRFGIDTGFSEFLLQDQLNGEMLRSQRLRRLLLTRLLGADAEQPIFGYLHSVDPHDPYVPTPPFDPGDGNLPAEKYRALTFQLEGLGEDPRELRHLKRLYAGEASYTDLELGRFIAMLRFLGLYDDSIVIVLSDHGEEFREHGGYGHGRTLYEEQLRVPLMIKYPDSQWGGTRIERAVSTLDIVPTILRLTQTAPRVALDGLSLLPPDLESGAPRILYSEVSPKPSEHLAAVDYRALRLDQLKCIQSLGEVDQQGDPVAEWQVFDLAEDPGEQNPLSADDPRTERCLRLFDRWNVQREEIASKAPEMLPATDQEALDQLRALGYIQ